MIMLDNRRPVLKEKYAPPNEEEIRCLDLATDLVAAFRQIDHRMTSSYMAGFLTVAKSPGLGPSLYAGMLETTQPVASRILQEISSNPRVRGEGLGLVDSEIDPDNRRQHNYFLTRKGHMLVGNLMTHYERYKQKVGALGASAPKPDMKAATVALMEAIPVLDPTQAEKIAAKVVRAAVS
jgi:DNA-binding MarR family transcriptional regulator